ncbi:MAG TPA: DUF2017 domain-containing protein [Mycobacteriales bacterium]|nr:DUF2017 domain-containing protein [Mycobacteriales bacterium]
MGSVKRRGGLVRIGLDDPEVVLLASLVAQVLELLGGSAEAAPRDPVEALLTLPPQAEVETPQDPVLARLLPDAYRDDADAAGEFRRLMDGELRAQKCAVLRRVLDDLATGRRKGGELRLELDSEAASEWLYAINDVRLTLGTTLGVTEEILDEVAELEPDSPRFLQLGIYDWMTWLQDAMVRSLAD